MFNKVKRRRQRLAKEKQQRAAAAAEEKARTERLAAEAAQAELRRAGCCDLDAQGWDLQTDLGALVVVVGENAPHKDMQGRVAALQLHGPYPTADVDLLTPTRDVAGQAVYYLHELQRVGRPAAAALSEVATA